MARMVMGALSACLFATALLIWAGPPEGRITIERHGARQAMAAAVMTEIGTGIGRLAKLVTHAPPRETLDPVTREKAELSALCDGITREADVIANVRAGGLYSYDQMITDAGDDPVLSWLVTLAWAVVPDNATKATLDRYHTIVARDCARAFA